MESTMITREPCRHILELPNEILLQIAKHVDIVHDRLHLLSSCTSFKKLLIKEWERLSPSMTRYPYSYMAIVGNKLREALADEYSELYKRFRRMIHECTDPKLIAQFCKRHAPATTADLQDLTTIQKDVIEPMKKILGHQDAERYDKEIHTFWVYCDLFREDMESEMANNPVQNWKRFDWAWRRDFLATLICPPPERWKGTPRMHLDQILDNEQFKVSLPAKLPVTLQARGVSNIVKRVLLHGGLKTFKIIATGSAVIDEDGAINSKLPSDVADHVAKVIASVSAVNWSYLPWDQIGTTRESWEEINPHYWYSLESDLRWLRKPDELDYYWDDPEETWLKTFDYESGADDDDDPIIVAGTVG